MINLKEIKTVAFDDDKMPAKWSDLDWENPMINDPRYLYSIHAAMTERVCKERTYPVSNTNDIWLNNHLDEFTFHKGELFSYRYFECLYSWVLNYLQDFINPDTVSRAWKFVDGEYVAAPQLMQYNDAEFSEILGYNFRELPLSFQPYEYYGKFLKGMKNAVQAMKWVYWPLIHSNLDWGRGSSYGSSKHEDDVWTFTNGNWDEVWPECKDDCIERWNREKLVDNANIPCTTRWYRTYVREYDSDIDDYKLVGTYDDKTVEAHLGTSTLESIYKWPIAADIKVFYVPYNESNLYFYDNDNYKSYLIGDDFGNKVKLWHEETTQAGERYVCSKKVTITEDNLSFNRNFQFPSEADPSHLIQDYTNRSVPHFFALLNISTGCNWL